jgi:chromosome segregation ATPase
MGDKILSNQIRGLKVFDSFHSQLELCKSHSTRLSEKIVDDIQALVQSPLFREKCKDLYRDVKPGSHFNIRLTDHSLVVQLMHRDATSDKLIAGPNKLTLDLSMTVDREMIGIHETILNKADRIFKKCQEKHFHSDSHSTSSSLRSRSNSFSILSEPKTKKTSTHRRSASWSPGTSHSSEIDNFHKELRQAQEAQLNLKLSAAKLSSNASHEESSALQVQISALEKQISALCQKLDVANPQGSEASAIAPMHDEIQKRLAAVEARLTKIEELLNQLLTPQIVPSSSPSSQGSSPRQVDSGEELEETRYEMAEVMAKVTSLENKIERTRFDLTKLEEDTHSQEQTISILNHEIERASQREQQHHHQIDELLALLKQHTEHQNQSALLEKELHQVQKTVAELQKDLFSKDQTISQLNQDILKAHQEIDRHNIQSEEKTHAQVSENDKKLKAAVEAIQQLEENARAYEQALSRIQKEAEQSAQKQQQLLKELENLSSEKKEKDSQIAQLNNQIKETTNLLKKQDEEITLLKTNDAEKEKTVQTLKATLSDLESQLNQAQQKLVQKEKELGLISTEKEESLKELEKQHLQIKTAYGQLEAKLKRAEEDFDRKLEALEKNSSSLRRELDSTTKQLASKKESLKEARADHQKSQETLQKTLKELEEAQKTAQRSAASIEELGKKIHSIELAMKEESQKADHHAKSVQELQLHQSEMEALLKQSENEKISQQQEIDKLMNQRDAEKSNFEKSKLEQQAKMEELENQKKELQTQLEKNHLEKSALLNQNNQLANDLDTLEKDSKKLQVELESVQKPAIDKVLPADQGVNDAVEQGREAAQHLDEIVSAMSDEPLYFLESELDGHFRQSLLEGFRLNRQLSQIKGMEYDKKEQKLNVRITEELAEELNIPAIFSLTKASHILGSEFKLNIRTQLSKIKEITLLPLIKRLNDIRSELHKAATTAESSDTTPWKTWGEVFKNFTRFCQQLNKDLPRLNRQIKHYHNTFEQLEKELKVGAGTLKQWVTKRTAPKNLPKEQQEKVIALIKLHREMTKNCERILLQPLPTKVPLHHAWKIYLLTKFGLPARVYTKGKLNEKEAQVVEPLKALMEDFYSSFAKMLERVEIEKKV